jgi:hypothetical protein
MLILSPEAGWVGIRGTAGKWPHIYKKAKEEIRKSPPSRMRD